MEKIPQIINRSWWDMRLCLGICKDGHLCQRSARRAFEERPGDLVIPLTCNIHADQENKIRSKEQVYG